MAVEGDEASAVVDAVRRTRAAVEGLQVVPLLAATASQRLQALQEVEALSRQVEAVRLRLVRALDVPAIGTAGPAGLGATTLPALLAAELGTGAGRAQADVAAARATDADAALDPVAGQVPAGATCRRGGGRRLLRRRRRPAPT